MFGADALKATRGTSVSLGILEGDMEQVITAPDDEWITYIAKMWLLGSQISKDVIGEEMDGSMADLARIQKILESHQIPVTNTRELQSLGILLGKVFVNETDGYDWWVVEDEYGKNACVRFKQTTLLAFPQTIISKRVEGGEQINVQELFTGLRDRLETLRKEGYANA